MYDDSYANRNTGVGYVALINSFNRPFNLVSFRQIGKQINTYMMHYSNLADSITIIRIKSMRIFGNVVLFSLNILKYLLCKKYIS